MPFPLIPILIGAAISGGSQVASSITSRKNNQDTIDHSREVETIRDKRERDLARDDRAFQESQLNPFRHQMNQARSIGALDLMANSSYKPLQMDRSGPYGQYMPQTTGGYSFESSPDVQQAAQLLKRSVISGQARPTGSTGGLNLLQLMAAGAEADPTAPGVWSSPATAVPSELYEDPRSARRRIRVPEQEYREVI